MRLIELFCMTGEFAGRRFRIADEATIGSAADNDVVLESATVSRHHARITASEGGYRLEDLGSSNGTRLDGDLLREPEWLDELHVVTFAEEHDFVVRRGAGTAR